jgi:tetratricopeptide (TPR) repeat protein
MPPHVSAPKNKRNNKPAGSRPFENIAVQMAALIVITVVAYANSLHGKFVFDDQQIVLQNPALMNIHSLNDAIVLGTGWRQLLFFTYGLNYYLSGLNTFSYHVLNVIIHVVNVLLVYGIILAALGNDRRARFTAFSGAAVFGVHTMLSGSVSYIAGRSSELCGTFYFGAILLFLAGLASTRRHVRILCFVFAGIAGLLAWQAKQEAITLPLFLAAVLFLRIEKKDWRWIVPLAAVPGIVVILVRDQLKALYTTVGNNQVLVSAGFDKVLPPAAYFRTYITAAVSYFIPRFVFPAGLSADPQVDTVEYWYSPEFLFAVAVFALLVWIALRFYRREPLLSLGIAALLVSPLAAYAVIPLADVVLEHRGYIPGLGAGLLFAWVFHWIARNYPHLRWPVVASLVIAFSLMTVSRNRVFADNISLWEDAVAKAPAKPRPHFNLGQAYQDAQRLTEAVQQYEQALALKPDIHAAYSNMAAIYLDQKQFNKGEEMLQKVTTLSPTFTEGFINLAVLYIRRQEPDKALAAINHALELNPDSFAAHYNKGEALTQKGEFKLALESYKEAVHLRPDLDSFRLTLGLAYSRAGDRDSAEKEFNLLTSGPVAPDAFHNLGVLYSDAGRLDQAVQYLDQATKLRTVFPDAYHDLGIAYLRKQMLDAAIEQFQTVLRQQPDHGPGALNLAMAQQLKGDLPAARQTLQVFLERYGNSNSPFVQQARQRLAALPGGK